MKSPANLTLAGLMIVDTHEQVRYWQMHYRISVWRLVLVGFSAFRAITASAVKRRLKREKKRYAGAGRKGMSYIPTQQCGSFNPCNDAVLQGGAAICVPLLEREPGRWTSGTHGFGRVSPQDTLESAALRADVITVKLDPIGLLVLTMIRHRHLIQYLLTIRHMEAAGGSTTHQLTEVTARNTVIGLCEPDAAVKGMMQSREFCWHRYGPVGGSTV